MDDERIIFFDGFCNLCNAAIAYLIMRDHRQVFYFAPLQGETARRRLPPEYTNGPLGTVVFWRSGQFTTHSTAALDILITLGGLSNIWRAAYVVPKRWRDWVYNFIARHRYGWFGRRDTCRVPTESERVRFLP